MKFSLTSTVKQTAILTLLAASLTACGQNNDNKPAAPPASTPAPATAPAAPAASSSIIKAAAAADAYKLITDELNKAADGKPDYALAAKTYNEQLKPLVQKRDSETGETIDSYITAAIEGAKDGKMNGMVAKQLVDKLLQEVFYTSMKATFKETTTNWAKPEEAKKLLAEAKAFYKPVLETTVGKRDTALKTTMADTISGAFGQMEQAIGGQSTLPFDLGRQVVDKTLMKTFYLAIAAKDTGYAYKVEKGASEGKDVKVEQAEGWAFFQSISKYVAGQAKEDAELINSQFDLKNDPKTVKAASIHGALIRGMSKVALDEYKQSQANWGKDKAAVTALEGALFIELLSADITALQGEAAYKALHDQAEKYNSLVKENKKDESAALLQEIETSLNALIAKTAK